MSQSRFQTVGILGAGTIGSSWAAFYASKGLAVRFFDSDKATQDKALPRILDFLKFLRTNELAQETDCARGEKNLAAATSIEEVAASAEFIQESTTEDYAVKGRMFAEADKAASPDTIIASSSSGLLVTQIQKAMCHPERALIAHPFNPPHLIPLVELVPGQRTSEPTLERSRTFFEGLGKIPVVLKKEVPGHIANRLAAALWREAINLVASGVASVEDVDKALYAGPGLRYAIMGQHLNYHLGGGAGGYRRFIDHIGKTFEAYWKTMPTWTQIPADAQDAIVSGMEEAVNGRSVAEICAWRDEKLVKVLKAVYGEAGKS
jgi:3-hydroxyacyl-CoA dehydrogenase